MRRLTLILSDFYLPADADRGNFTDATRLPNLDGLLRFSKVERINDWRRWLAREWGGSVIADWPPAHVCALAADLKEPAGTWIATPLRLEARLDHVRLSNRGMLRLPSEQLATLAQEFQATFGPEALIAGGNSRGLLLRGGPSQDARTVDPARLLDTDVGPALPAGPGGGELRRLGAEIEMWLPGTRTNAERQRAHQPQITTLWFWGGGAVDARPRGNANGANLRILGGDFFLAALVKLISGDGLRPAPRDFAKLRGEGDSVCVELAPLSGSPEESLPAIEQNWFAPLREALGSGRLEQVQLLANDRVFTVRARAGWRFWRRKRNWLESLA